MREGKGSINGLEKRTPASYSIVIKRANEHHHNITNSNNAEISVNDTGCRSPPRFTNACPLSYIAPLEYTPKNEKMKRNM